MKFMNMNSRNWDNTYRDEADDGSDGSSGDDNSDGDDSSDANGADDSDNSNDDADGDSNNSDENEDGADGNGNAPDTYADFDLPEGMVMDEPMLAKALERFKADGLTQEQAQGYITDYAESVQAATEQMAQQHIDQVAEWETALKADKDIGGDKLDQSLANANKALDQYGDQETKEYLDKSGLGKNPMIVRLLNGIGADLGEDVPGGNNSGGGKTRTPEQQDLDTLYPND